MLREADAAEIHLRITSPPVRWPCYYGIDIGERSELLAADLSVGEIREYLDVDSLAYLELDRVRAATGAPPESFCTACVSGEYPVPVALTSKDSKLLLEAPVLDLTESSASRPS
jgi:amidophosphoribosyltransferase